ncbi:hypothetical protein [Anaerotardibacter muris]|uniref:hypothetical protein n=1 Tax=Anaerotardibacter muris TaxID=2941505 RepID=UPI00203E8319|nr:hypothetical protein [Anaerotardibacter muris]
MDDHVINPEEQEGPDLLEERRRLFFSLLCSDNPVIWFWKKSGMGLDWIKDIRPIPAHIYCASYDLMASTFDAYAEHVASGGDVDTLDMPFILYMMKLENKEVAYYRLNNTNLGKDLKKKLAQKISKMARQVDNGVYFCRKAWLEGDTVDLQNLLNLDDEQASDLIRWLIEVFKWKDLSDGEARGIPRSVAEAEVIDIKQLASLLNHVRPDLFSDHRQMTQLAILRDKEGKFAIRGITNFFLSGPSDLCDEYQKYLLDCSDVILLLASTGHKDSAVLDYVFQAKRDARHEQALKASYNLRSSISRKVKKLDLG